MAVADLPNRETRFSRPGRFARGRAGLSCLLAAAVLACLFLLPALPAVAAEQTLAVVIDDNYPPYIFPSPAGQVQGLLVDLWKAFETHNGVKVDLKAMDWAKALESIKDGRADVIDTIFFSPERAQFLDFSKPYERIEVPVFSQKGLGGITDVESLRGFAVGVKAGDSCIDMLRKRGITSLIEFDSYESIIRAAGDKQIRVFCVDEPAAIYYIYKFNLEDEFRLSFTLYANSFHRAVPKGRADLLALVENGFARIPAAEMEALRSKWLGSPLVIRKYLDAFYLALGAGAAVAVLLSFFNMALRRQVRRKTEELRLSEARLSAIINNTSSVIYLKDTGHRYLLINTSFSELFHITQEEIAGKTDYEVYPRQTADSFRANDLAVMDGKTIMSFEEKVDQDDGEHTYISVKFPLFDAEGHVYAVCGISTDITGLKRAEEAIRRSLEEKTVLLKEVHHRVKNNLQIIVSLLSLQAQDIADPAVAELFNRGKNRVHSMALVHELLYRTASLSRLSLAGYIASMAAHIKSSYQDQSGGVELVLDLDDVAVDSGLAIPCGLILNELLTNAFKHAFSEQGRGVISVSLQAGKTHATLVVADSGKGLPDLDLHTTPSLGMRLISALVQQIRGEFEVANQPGARFVIRFPLTDA